MEGLLDRVAADSGEQPFDRSGRLDAAAADAVLVAAMCAGHGSAFAELVARHTGPMLAVARRMLRDDAEAEDVVQEAMLRLWRSADRLEITGNGVRPWLRRVVSNLCIDRVRVGRNTAVVDEVPEQPVAASQVAYLEQKETAMVIDAALKALPERQRLALVLFHYEGLSQIEVGQTMAISDEAVESLLARARRSLKASLAPQWRALLPTLDDGLT